MTRSNFSTFQGAEESADRASATVMKQIKEAIDTYYYVLVELIYFMRPIESLTSNFSNY